MDERIIKSTTPPSASPCSSLVSDASMIQEEEEEDSVSEASASSCSISGENWWKSDRLRRNSF